MVSTRHVVRRFLLAKLARVRQKTALDLSKPLPTLWLENEEGEKFIPETFDEEIPEGFIYQHSRFPRSLVENVLRTITEEDVETCDHPEVSKDHGLIEGLEGRICQYCGGSQTKRVGEPWPEKWRSGGSRNVMRGESSYPADLVLAMVRPTPTEIQKAKDRGHTIAPIDYNRAVLIAGSCCERCMNVLMYRHGLDDGYEEGSDGWKRSGTSCLFCE